LSEKEKNPFTHYVSKKLGGFTVPNLERFDKENENELAKFSNNEFM